MKTSFLKFSRRSFCDLFTIHQVQANFIKEMVGMHGKVFFILIIHVLVVINHLGQCRLKIENQCKNFNPECFGLNLKTYRVLHSSLVKNVLVVSCQFDF